ncbi:MAG: ArnT family glycosyltransferase, partial [Endomicrobiia bacterium]
MKKKSKIEEKPEISFNLWLPLGLFIVFFIVWTYILFKYYFEKYPVNLNMLGFVFSLKEFGPPVFLSVISAFLSHLYSIFIVLVILVSAFGLGERIRKILILEVDSLAEKFLFSVGFGFGLLIFLTFIIGLFGALYKELFVLIFVFLTFLGVLELKKNFSKNALQNQKDKKKSFLFFLIKCIIFACGLVTLITALTPETFYDSMQYHIGVPLLWVLEHKIHEIPTIGQSYYQMNIHLLFAIGLLLRNEQVVKLLNFLFGILSVWTIYIFSKKFFSRETGILASLIFFSTPIVLFVFSRTCVELPIAFFDLLMLFCFLNFLETENNKWLFSSAVFMGLSIGSKYISFASFFSLIGTYLIYSIFFKGEHILKDIKRITIWAFISGFLFLPWAIKNYVYIKNPIYPFTIDREKGLSLIGARKMDYTDQSKVPLNPKNIFTMPWRITMGEFQESFSGPVFLFLLPFLFFVKKIPEKFKFLIFYILFWYLLWIPLARGYIRHFIPALAPLSILLSFYLCETRISSFFKKSIIFILVIFSLANLFFILSSQKMSQNPIGYVLGLQSKEEYLSIMRPTYVCPYYPVINWANKNLPKEAKIVFMGET